MAAILFLDVKGAFPNAVSTRLLHNMRMCHVPEEYVLFVHWLLTNRRTWLKFDGFTSDWIDVDNSIVQGDPLFMILYLFYNADLLEDVGKMETKVGYVMTRSTPVPTRSLHPLGPGPIPDVSSRMRSASRCVT